MILAQLQWFFLFNGICWLKFLSIPEDQASVGCILNIMHSVFALGYLHGFLNFLLHCYGDH